MHESTRRSLCRAAFVFLAALPVLIAVFFSVAEYIPAYREARKNRWEQELSQTLGIDVRIGKVDVRSPNRTLLHQLEIVDAEQKSLIAKLPIVECVQSEHGTGLRAAYAEFSSKELVATLRRLHENFIRRPASTHHVAVVVLDNAKLLDQVGREDRFARVQLDFKWTSSRVEIDGKAHVSTQPEEVPTTFHMVRTHGVESAAGAEPQSTQIKVQTGSAPVPFRWIAMSSPDLSDWGKSAWAAGQVEARLDRAGWWMRFEGDLTGVDATELTNPPIIDGLGSIHISELIATQAGLSSIRGSMSFRRGHISHNLLMAAYNGLQAQIAPNLSQLPNPYRYEKLDVNFDLDRRGLEWSGEASHLAVFAKRDAAPGKRIPLSQFIVAISGSTLGKPIEQAVVCDIVESGMLRLLMRNLSYADANDAAKRSPPQQLHAHN